jgi:hypothetical protein
MTLHLGETLLKLNRDLDKHEKIPAVFRLPHRPGSVNRLTQPNPIRVMSLAWAGLKSMSSSGLGWHSPVMSQHPSRETT